MGPVGFYLLKPPNHDEQDDADQDAHQGGADQDLLVAGGRSRPPVATRPFPVPTGSRMRLARASGRRTPPGGHGRGQGQRDAGDDDASDRYDERRARAARSVGVRLRDPHPAQRDPGAEDDGQGDQQHALRPRQRTLPVRA